jgi:hypothetical protein
MKNKLEEYENHIESLNQQLNQEKQANQELMYRLKTHVSQEHMYSFKINHFSLKLIL